MSHDFEPTEAERGIEESRKKFGRFYTQINPPVQENEWGEKEAFGSDDIENFWIDVLHQELQKAREEERERCIQAIKNPLTNWECTANLEDGDAHNHKTITVCRAVASINSDKTNGL